MCTKEQFKVEGKRAFHPDKDPSALNPYPQSDCVRAHDLWLEGWWETATKNEQKIYFLSNLHDQFKQTDPGIEERKKATFTNSSIFLNHVQCDVFEEYFAQRIKNTSCWQLARKKDDFRFDCHVCQDCIVYKYAKPDDECIRQQVETILHKRRKCRTSSSSK